MIVLLSAIFLIGIGLAIYAFLPNKQEIGFQEQGGLGMLRFPQSPAAADAPVNNAETERLGMDVERLKAENDKLYQEGMGLRENEAQLKAENVRLKDALSAKERELEKAASQDPGASGELAEAKDKLNSLIEENKEFSEKIAALESQVTKASAEAARVSAEAVKGSADSEKLKAANDDALSKIKMLEMQIEQHKKEAFNPQDFVPRKEYEELKKKLEEAEAVLKMVHGTGE